MTIEFSAEANLSKRHKADLLVIPFVIGHKKVVALRGYRGTC